MIPRLMQIGNIHLPLPMVQAGLAGYSDRAMRLVARRRGCPYAVTEALLDVIILNGGEGLRRSIDINDEDHPIAAQLIGADPHTMARAAVIMANAGHDVIDVNLACPVKKIRNKLRGGHLLSDIDTAIAILKAVRDALPPHVPTTLKLRKSYDDSPESLEGFHRVFNAAFDNNYAAVAVHARTVEQKYLGVATWDFLRQLKQQYPTRPILGSGDLFDAAAALRMLRETGVDGLWLARGAIGNPWIFADIARLLNGAPESELHPPTVHQQRDALSEHFIEAMKLHGEQLAGRRMRKMGIRYARFHPQSDQVKQSFIQVRSLRDWQATLDRWYTLDAPGIHPPIEAVNLA